VLAHSPSIALNGLVLCLDAANTKSYSQNVFPYPLDGYSWGTSGYQMTVSRDTSTSSPVGNSPLKLVTSGTSAYTGTYNSLPFTLSPAAQGQTWTFSFWVKGSSSFSASMLIFESNSSGGYITYGQPYYSVTTEWTRVSGSYTMTQAAAAGVQVRIDCYVNGVTLWADGFQLEKASSASSFNSVSNANGTIWTDLTRNGNTGTLTNGPTYSSANGGSIVFDGVDDYVIATRPSSIVAGGQITISLWAKWITTGTTTSTIQMLLDNNHSGAPQGFVIQDRPDLGKSLTFSVIPNQSGAVSTFIVGDGSWHHITGTNDGSTSKLYIDGVFNSKATESGGIISVYPNITLGLWQNGGRYLNGNISTTQIYNRALTAAEVSQNFNALRGRYGI
jgi:hypothetical protein